MIRFFSYYLFIDACHARCLFRRDVDVFPSAARRRYSRDGALRLDMRICRRRYVIDARRSMRARYVVDTRMILIMPMPCHALAYDMMLSPRRDAVMLLMPSY